MFLSTNSNYLIKWVKKINKEPLRKINKEAFIKFILNRELILILSSTFLLLTSIQYTLIKICTIPMCLTTFHVFYSL